MLKKEPCKLDGSSLELKMFGWFVIVLAAFDFFHLCKYIISKKIPIIPFVIKVAMNSKDK